MPEVWQTPITLSASGPNGVLSGTSETVAIGPYAKPITATLKFTSLTTQKIELSTDGGIEFFEPAYAANSATMRVITVGSPVSHIKFTGVIGNTWRIN